MNRGLLVGVSRRESSSVWGFQTAFEILFPQRGSLSSVLFEISPWASQRDGRSTGGAARLSLTALRLQRVFGSAWFGRILPANFLVRRFFLTPDPPSGGAASRARSLRSLCNLGLQVSR